MSFKKISGTEYEIVLQGRTKSIFVPFAKTQKLFIVFIQNGGIIDEEGRIQTDIITLIDSFKDVADLLLTEHDEEGHVVKEGNCSNLDSADVISLFQLASEVLQSFILELTAMQKPQETPNQPNEEENVKDKKTTKKA